MIILKCSYILRDVQDYVLHYLIMSSQTHSTNSDDITLPNIDLSDIPDLPILLPVRQCAEKHIHRLPEDIKKQISEYVKSSESEKD